MSIYNLNIGFGSTIDTTRVDLVGLQINDGTKLRLSHLNTLESYTYVLSFWYKIGSTAPIVDRPLLQTSNGSSTGISGSIRSGGNLVNTIYNGSQSSKISSNTPLPMHDDIWHHVILAERSYPAKQHLYIDGVVATSSVNTFTADLPFKFQDIWALFNNATPDGKSFNGCIDQVYFSFEDILLSNPTQLERFISSEGAPVPLSETNAYILLRGKEFTNEGIAPVEIHNDNFYIECGGVPPNDWFSNFNQYTYNSAIAGWVNLNSTIVNYLKAVEPGRLANELPIQATTLWGIDSLIGIGEAEILVDIIVNTSGTYNNGLAVRILNKDTYYAVAVNEVGDIVLYYKNGGLPVNISYVSRSYTTGDTITCRFKITNTNLISIKFWNTNNIEPSTWDIYNYNLSNNNIPILNSGYIGITNEGLATSYEYNNMAVTLDGTTAQQPNVSPIFSDSILPYVYWLRERMEKMSESGLNGLNMIRRLF